MAAAARGVARRPVSICGSPWQKLCATSELDLRLTLSSGQVFTWQQHPLTREWSGVIDSTVFRLREQDDYVQFQWLNQNKSDDGSTDDNALHTAMRDAISNFFRLETQTAPLYAKWTEPDDSMSQAIKALPGLRIVRQDPVECLFGFICSSNNNIGRISKMMQSLKTSFGQRIVLGCICETQKKEHEAIENGIKCECGGPFFKFPSVEKLASCEEAQLRALGFGYRARFVCESAKRLEGLGGRLFLLQLRECSTLDEVVDELVKFSGVGRKVADCIALFALEKLDAIPVDTHVRQIACREFDAALAKRKSLTPALYQQVGDHFRTRFGPFAGWAHSVLFAGDLPRFQRRDAAQDTTAVAKRPVDQITILKRRPVATKKKLKANKENLSVLDGKMAPSPENSMARADVQDTTHS